MKKVPDNRQSLLAAVLGVVVLLAFSPTSSADQSEGRGAVKDFEFSYSPSATRSTDIPGLSIGILPLINSNNLTRHTKNIDKATRNMSAAEVPRILGIRYSAYGKPLNRFLTPVPFELTIQGAIESELLALGMDVVLPMNDEPPANLRERTLAAMVNEMPGDKVPDLLLAAEIEDFFFETTTGAFKLKMETFFALEVLVFDTSAREIIWEGTVEVGELEKKTMFMGKEAVENRLHAAFAQLIENVMRNNDDLKRTLAALD